MEFIRGAASRNPLTSAFKPEKSAFEENPENFAFSHTTDGSVQHSLNPFLGFFEDQTLPWIRKSQKLTTTNDFGQILINFR